MTKTKLFSSLLIASIISVAGLLSGCKQETPVTPPDSETNIATESEYRSETVAETKSITITVFNLSNVQIGMFSVIDPATGEQMNLDSLEPGQSVSMECNWPNDVSLFQWALYNVDGELCMDASTDISEAEKSVILVLTGEGNIDDITALFDKEVSDLDQ